MAFLSYEHRPVREGTSEPQPTDPRVQIAIKNGIKLSNSCGQRLSDYGLLTYRYTRISENGRYMIDVNYEDISDLVAALTEAKAWHEAHPTPT